MSVRIHKVLTSEGFEQLNKDSMTKGFYNTDRRIFPPGTAWLMDWCYDPSGEREKNKKHVLFKAQDRENILFGCQETHTLSMYYWKDWSHIRPPITLVCPDGNLWCPDKISSNGPGWKVSGDLPFITCHPSIDFSPQYHGWLVKGLFSTNLNADNSNVIPIKPTIP